MIIAPAIIPLEVRTIDKRRALHIPKAARRLFRAIDGTLFLAEQAMLGAEDGASAMAAAESAIVSQKADRLLFNAFRDIVTDVFPVFAQLEAGRLEKIKRADPVNVWADFILKYLAEESGLLIRRITVGTLAVVRAVLIEGIEEGLGIEPLARRMRQRAGQFSRRRAVRIARTEVISASNAATRAGAIATGLTLQKVWLATTTDGRTRQSHLDAHAEYHANPIDLDDIFYVGGYPCDYPAASNLPAHERIHCRCTHFHIPI